MLQLALTLEQNLLAQGWLLGPPSHVPPERVAAGIRLYESIRCPECGGRLRVAPLHLPPALGQGYALLCACRRCGTAFEG